ncbi:MAG TPA: hypothetical protein VFE31_12945 [Opitutaceae bacterium]|jgi:hypothetical protein|nr:hypothetical protein [Opitutaceae bacterium]
MRSAASAVNRHFYLIMALVAAAAVAYGFGHTIGARLLHAQPRPPAILTVHALIFSSWIVLLIVQSALVSTRNVRLHMTLGTLGFAFGVLMPIVGIATAVAMARFKFETLKDPTAAPFFAVQLWDMTVFTTLFWLGFSARRTNKEAHRRLIMAATFALLVAAFARFPQVKGPTRGYLCVDSLFVIAIARDWLTERRIHRAYAVTLAAFAVSQPFILYLALGKFPPWTALTARYLR